MTYRRFIDAWSKSWDETPHWTFLGWCLLHHILVDVLQSFGLFLTEPPISNLPW